jgi:hypothetical protein
VEVLFVKLITTGNLPLQLVQLPEFRDFIYYLNPDVEIWLPTSHQTIKTWLMRQYDIEKINIKSKIKGALTQIHLTTDLWTSPNNLPVLGVVANYISPDKKLEKTTLALRQLSGPHSGANIAAHLLEVIEDFDIASNLGYFQADNASNNDTACSELSIRTYDSQSLGLKLIQGYSVVVSISSQLELKRPKNTMLWPYPQSRRTGFPSSPRPFYYRNKRRYIRAIHTAGPSGLEEVWTNWKASYVCCADSAKHPALPAFFAVK